ncbi:MAG: DUF1080 domain-containing protein [Gemmatimonadota bacterium]
MTTDSGRSRPRPTISAALAAWALMPMLACAQPAPETSAMPAAETDAAMQRAPNTLTAAEQAAGWKLLFDGKTTAGWRGWKQEAMPEGWAAVDGTLTRTAGGGGDIITVDQYDNFELALDWKIAPGGNSGIFFHVTEEGDAMYWSAPEFQVLDDSAHADGLVPETSAGANYALNAPTKEMARPVGEWNEARILVNGPHVEHWLNGEKIVEYELWSDDWKARVAASKFAAWPIYGMAKTGYIGLQEHGSAVAYRNIRIRPIPSGGS